MLNPGDSIGPYQLVRELGAGSFGVAWLANKVTRITTQFALKVPKRSSSPDHLLREWLEEAERWATMTHHPNIVPIIEADEFNVSSANGRHIATTPHHVFAIVSEYVDGGTIYDWLSRQSGRLPNPNIAIEMISQLLEGVAHLHRDGFVHRDLKPANVFLQGGKPRIGDFGLARALDDTLSLQLAGTPVYMAPEAFRNERSPQLDLWSVAVMLFEMLHGYRPFSSSDQILSAAPITPSKSISDHLQQVLHKGLNKLQRNRFASADDFLRSLKGSSAPLAPLHIGPQTAAITDHRAKQRQRALDDPSQGL